MNPMIVVHGGAWFWDDALHGIKREGLQRAVEAGYAVLRKHGSALDAVEAAVRLLEDDPVFDSGTGGYLDRQGIVRLDALIADGKELDFGAIAAVSNVKNPVSLARAVMERTEQCFYVGAGADLVAEELGMQLVSNDSLVTSHMQSFYDESLAHDTVGAVAMDLHGNTAVATSTSGSPLKPVGRVGDSPLYGSGGYAENSIGAVGATGQGENIMRLLLSKYTSDLMRQGASAMEAAKAAIAHADLRFEKSMSGVIVIDSEGKPAFAHSTPKMAVGWITRDGMIRTAMHQSEFN